MPTLDQNLKLREYQIQTISQIKKNLSMGVKRLAVSLPTGSGKTVIFAALTRNIVDQGNRVLIIVRRKSIVVQTAKRLGGEILMSGHPIPEENAPIIVASIDTLVNRVSKYSPDIVIVDEMHDTSSFRYTKVLKHYADLIHIGFSASIFPTGSKGFPHWKKLISPISASVLRDEGYLCDVIAYAPMIPKTDDIKLSAGDFHKRQLQERMSELGIIRDLVGNVAKFIGERKGILFAVNVEHSKLLCEKLNAAGIPSTHVDAGTPLIDRLAALNNLTSGKIKLITNVNIFSTGVNIPNMDILIMARPTRSQILFVQQIGRGMRPYPGKKNLLFLDCAGNSHRFGHPYSDREPSLTGIDKKNRPAALEVKILQCPKCFFINPIEIKNCFKCGAVLGQPKHIKELTTADLQLMQQGDINFGISYDELKKRTRSELKKFQNIGNHRGYHSFWAYYRVIDSVGFTTANKFISLPKWIISRYNK